MSISKTPIYFVPGLAAGKEIFENINFPEDRFDVRIIEWIIPKKNEVIQDYAKRMATKVTQENAVLIGVSFGGVMVQEMCQYLNLKKLIIISSVKSTYEIPKKMKIFKYVPLYRLIPNRFLENSKSIVRYGLGVKSKTKLELYQKYLSVNNTHYLKWAIKNMVGWNRTKLIPDVIHIHGDKDPVFPIHNIDNCIIIPGGTHIMLIVKFKWLNVNLPKIIEGTYS